MSNKSRLSTRLIAGGIMGITMLLSNVANAVQWIETNNGLYHQGSRWAGGAPPTSSQSAEFTLSAGSLVLWDDNTGDTTSQFLTVRNGNFIFTGCCGAAGIPFTHTTTSLTRVENNGSLTLGNHATEPMNLFSPSDFNIDTGGTTAIRYGSDVTVRRMQVGTSGGAPSVLNIDGPGSSLNTTLAFSGIELGDQGGRGALNMSNGAVASVDGLTLASFGFDTVNSQGHVNILSGARLETGSAYVARSADAGAVGNVLVSGANSLLKTDALSSFIVGASSDSTATVAVQSGGEISLGSALNGGLIVNQTGTVTVRSGGRLGFRLDAVAPRIDVNGGALTFENGSAQQLLFGQQIAVRNGGLFDMSFFNYTWSGGMDLSLTSGGTLRTAGATFSQDAELTVNGGSYQSTSGFTIGDNGTVNLSAGSIEAVSFTDTAGGTFNHSGGTLVVNGGVFSISNPDLDIDGASNPRIQLINGATATARHFVGGSTQKGRLEVLGGSQLTNNGNGYIADAGAGSSEGSVLVSGASSRWDATGFVSVGDDGQGSLTIRDHGVVQSAIGYIGGRQAGGVGNASVANVGAKWMINGNLFLGGDGTQQQGTGTLEIADRGEVVAGGATKLYPSGTITLNFGDLSTRSFDNSLGGVFNHGVGTLTVDGGSYIPKAGRVNLEVESGVSAWRSTLHLKGIGAATVDGMSVGATNVNSYGELILSAGRTLTIDGWLEVGEAGTVRVESGSVARTINNNDISFWGQGAPARGFVSGPSSRIHAARNFGIGFSEDSHGHITLEDGGQLIADGGLFVDKFGRLDGNGTVQSSAEFRNFGHIAPGTSAGRIDVIGSFRNEPEGALEIEIGGTATSAFDRLVISNSAALGGALEVSLINGFAPSSGDRFEVLTAADVFGAFATEALPALSNSLEWYVEYTGTAVELVSTYAADFDLDGDVDGEDFLSWQASFGITAGATHADGDSDADGDVDGDDFLAWQGDFGSAAGSGGLAGAAVPEPTAAALCLMVCLTCLLSKRRRKSWPHDRLSSH